MYKVHNDKTDNDKPDNDNSQENKVKMMKQMLHEKMKQKMMQQKMQPPTSVPGSLPDRENFSLPKSKHKGMYLFILLLIVAVVGFFMWKKHTEKSGTKAGFKFY